jgi:hypothetical protein
VSVRSYIYNNEVKVIIEYRVLRNGVSCFTDYYEHKDELFETKEEVGKAWLKSQGLECGLH